MNYLIKQPPEKILSKEFFKYDLEVLYSRNVEDDISYAIDDLKTAYDKSLELIPYYTAEYEDKRRELLNKIGKAAFDYHAQKALKVDMKNIEKEI